MTKAEKWDVRPEWLPDEVAIEVKRLTSTLRVWAQVDSTGDVRPFGLLADGSRLLLTEAEMTEASREACRLAHPKDDEPELDPDSRWDSRGGA